MISWLWLIPTIAVSVIVGFYLGWHQHKRYLDLILGCYNMHTFDYVPDPSCKVAVPLSGPEVVTPVSYPQCAFDGCKASTGSSWDDMCIEHSLYQDSGRP